MIKGIGNDIIEIKRIRKVLTRYENRFLNHILTLKEQEYCFQYKDPVPRLAGRFAAKEAIAKALGTGFSKELNWLDIEILTDPKGKPAVFLSDPTQAYFSQPVIWISISHCQEYATAMAIWTIEAPPNIR
jgi:holo-[acyl-carrier protein] synthase